MRRIIVFVLLIHCFCAIKVSAQKEATSKNASILSGDEFLITGKIIGRDTWFYSTMIKPENLLKILPF